MFIPIFRFFVNLLVSDADTSAHFILHDDSIQKPMHCSAQEMCQHILSINDLPSFSLFYLICYLLLIGLMFAILN